jgi:hypothetical protein
VRARAAWKKLTPKPEATSRVFVESNGATFEGVHHATVFRKVYLKAAKIERPELFERGKNRLPVRVHDLRATFVTLALANGRTESWVSDRTGHKSTLMISRYRRTARQAEELGLGALAPLDEAIPELAAPEGVSGAVSGPGDVRGGSSSFGSPEASRALPRACIDGDGETPRFKPTASTVPPRGRRVSGGNRVALLAPGRVAAAGFWRDPLRDRRDPRKLNISCLANC